MRLLSPWYSSEAVCGDVLPAPPCPLTHERKSAMALAAPRCSALGVQRSAGCWFAMMRMRKMRRAASSGSVPQPCLAAVYRLGWRRVSEWCQYPSSFVAATLRDCPNNQRIKPLLFLSPGSNWGFAGSPGQPARCSWSAGSATAVQGVLVLPCNSQTPSEGPCQWEGLRVPCPLCPFQTLPSSLPIL